MGFRGRIWLYFVLVGSIVIALAAAVLGRVDVVVAVRSVGWVSLGLAAVEIASSVVVALGVGQLDEAIVSRRWWALSLLMEGIGLALLAALALRTLPAADDLEARMSFSWSGLVLTTLLSAAVILELWADRRAAPTVKGPLYRPRKQHEPDGRDVFAGPTR